MPFMGEGDVTIRDMHSIKIQLITLTEIVPQIPFFSHIRIIIHTDFHNNHHILANIQITSEYRSN